jgi:hypothetical protein
MGFTALIFAATVVVGGPSGEPVDSVERAAQIRCRPAPYHVAQKGEQRQKMQKTILTGSRVPIRRGWHERRARPCHLMNAPMIPQGYGPLKVAD